MKRARLILSQLRAALDTRAYYTNQSLFTGNSTRVQRRGVQRCAPTQWAFNTALRLQTLWSKRLGIAVTLSEGVFLSMHTNGLPELVIPFSAHSVRAYYLAPLSSPRVHGEITHPLFFASTAIAFNEWVERVEVSSGVTPAQPLDHYIDLVAVSNGDLYHEEYTYYCSDCDEHHVDSGEEYHIVTRLNRNHEVSCNTDRAFYCDISEEYYSIDSFCQGTTGDGNSICEEWASENGWEFDEDDEQWVHYGRGSSSSVPSYHSGDRGAIRRVIHQMGQQVLASPQDRMFGVEIEVEFPSAEARKGWYVGNRGTDACIERDGSLDDYRGLEIISPPLPLHSWQEGNFFTDLVESARKAGARGWQARSDYGVHVNCDLRVVTGTAATLIYAALNQMEDIVVAVSGRRPWRGTYQKVSRLHYNGERAYIHNSLVSTAMDDKYQPVRMSWSSPSPMMEVRAFGSNLRAGAMREYIELCASVIEWVQDLCRPFDSNPIGPLVHNGELDAGLFPPLLMLTDTSRKYLAMLESKKGEYPSIHRLLGAAGFFNELPTDLAGFTHRLEVEDYL